MSATALWISGGPLTDVTFGATGLESIVQCVRIILATRKGTVFLDRNFGLSQTMVDDPQPVAVQKFRGEVTEAIHRYEPRVEVLRVVLSRTTGEDANNGALYPSVLVRLTEKALL